MELDSPPKKMIPGYLLQTWRCKQPLLCILFTVLPLIIISGLLGRAAIGANQPRPQAPRSIRVLRVAKIAGVRVLWAKNAGRGLIVFRKGRVGRLDMEKGRITPLFGVPWRRAFLPTSSGHQARVPVFAGPAAASPSGNRVVVLMLWYPAKPKSAGPGRLGAWELWSVARATRLGSLSPSRFPSNSEQIPARGPRRIIFTDHGRKIVGFGRDGLFFFAAKSLLFVPSSSAETQAEHIVDLHQDQGQQGNLFAATCTMPGRVEIWNGVTEQRVVIIVPPAHVSWWKPGLMVSLSGDRCAVAWAGSVAIYDAKSGVRLVLRGFRGRCEGVALSPGGRRLLVCVRSAASVRAGVPATARATLDRLYVLSTVRGLRSVAISDAYPALATGRVQLLWCGKGQCVSATPDKVVLWAVATGSKR